MSISVEFLSNLATNSIMLLPYFAYGSNMDRRQFLQRCPNSILVCRAVLPGHKVIINTDGVASIVKSKSSLAHGVLALMTAEDEAILDGYEGVADGHYTKASLKVDLESGYKVECMSYIATNCKVGDHAKPGYLEKILYGSEFFKLPQDHIAHFYQLKRK